MSLVSFKQLKDGSAEDYARLLEAGPHDRSPASSVLALLETLKDGDDEGWPINVYHHTLQCGTLAWRDGADDETIVCAALHDIGDQIAPHDHGGFVADLLAPYISAENEWVLRYHPAFQMQYMPGYASDPTAHEVFRGHPNFERTMAFVEHWDQAAFDPDYPTLDVADFEPLVRRVLEKPRDDWPERWRRRRAAWRELD